MSFVVTTFHPSVVSALNAAGGFLSTRCFPTVQSLPRSAWVSFVSAGILCQRNLASLTSSRQRWSSRRRW